MIDTLPKITVVTPNFNQGAFIERTILSVLQQNYSNLEYVVIDGGSTDNSVDVIKKYENDLHYWVSESDNGMYHALNKGFDKSSGAIMCWINSDDILVEGSLAYVASVFQNSKKLQWLQGYPTVINEEDKVIYQRDPVASPLHFLTYEFEKDYSFIQQESTFWSRALWEKAGGKLDEQYALAADFDLWMRFFQHEKLFCTRKQLGAFRKREGQKSAAIDVYIEEARRSVQEHSEKLRWEFSKGQLKGYRWIYSLWKSFYISWIKDS